MNYMTAILLSLSSNLDTFAVCLTYGIKKVKLSITSSLLISFITSLGTFLSMILGKIMTSFISPKIVTSIGALPFFLTLLSLIEKRIENELLIIVLHFKLDIGSSYKYYLSI